MTHTTLHRAGGGQVSRRRLLGLAFGVTAMAACQRWQLDAWLRQAASPPMAGRLNARPHAASASPPPPGLYPLGLGRPRDGLVYVPASRPPGRPNPLVVALHGAGGNAQGGLAPLLPYADEAGLLLLAPESREETWQSPLGHVPLEHPPEHQPPADGVGGDLLRREPNSGVHGSDAAFIDQALAQTFDRHDVDPRSIGIQGFSDGASQALSLGLINGDLFGHILAFSPGYSASSGRIGRPKLFISHGRHDTVLGVETTRQIVAELRSADYDVTYQEFDGPHIVPPEIARAAVKWFLAA